MEQRRLGALWPVSALTLGGGGIGGVWGATGHAEAIATVRAAVDAGITLLDTAPMYGRGEAERVVGAAFEGRLPAGVRVTSKCMVGNRPPADAEARIRASVTDSLQRLRLEHIDLFFLHSNLVPDGYRFPDDPGPDPDGRPTLTDRIATPLSLWQECVRPTLDALVREGTIGAWGLTAVGLPSTLLEILGDAHPPAAIQAVTNLLDSAGGMRRYAEPAAPRALIEAAGRAGTGVLGIRAVQAGALCAELDRPLPPDHPERIDWVRAAPFRALAKESGEDPADLAHRYALDMPGVATVVLGVKNRAELAATAAAAARGPLPDPLRRRIDDLGLRS